MNGRLGAIIESIIIGKPVIPSATVKNEGFLPLIRRIWYGSIERGTFLPALILCLICRFFFCLSDLQ